MRHKLRLGLLIGNWNIPAWQFDMLAEVVESDYASIELVIQSDSTTCKENRRRLPAYIFRAFHRHETMRPAGIDACDISAANQLLSQVERMTIPSGHGAGQARERISIIADIKLRELDLILALDNISAVDSLVDVCRHGVWYYSYGYPATAEIDLSWIGFMEVLGRKPFIQSALMVRSSEFKDDRKAYESFSSVSPFSHTRTRSEHLWKIRAFVPRVLRQLHNYGDEKFIERLGGEACAAQPKRPPPPKKPSALRILASLIGYAWWRIKLKISRRSYTKKWTLMFQIGGDSRDLTKYRIIRPPEEWFWADPFAVRKDDRYYVFFEEASVESGHGHLSVICIDDSGNCSQAQTILERPYHLSYPFIFEWKQSMYMIPETADNRTVEVYRCKAFPNEWELECTLMEDVSAYDATLFEHCGTWWLFANIKEHDGASSWDELCLFSSDHPLSNDWRPHPMNPVISDVRVARPAGRMILRNGRLLRPSQNSSYRYGYGLNFCEVLELSESIYRERLIECIEPDWDLSVEALHTYNECDDLTVIDVVHRTRRSDR